MADYIKRALANSALIDSGIVGHDLEKAVNAITAVPAANVRPVVRGRWIEDDSGVVICSNCGEEHEWDEYRANFCDNCGADMRGKEDRTDV